MVLSFFAWNFSPQECFARGYCPSAPPTPHTTPLPLPRGLFSIPYLNAYNGTLSKRKISILSLWTLWTKSTRSALYLQSLPFPSAAQNLLHISHRRTLYYSSNNDLECIWFERTRSEDFQPLIQMVPFLKPIFSIGKQIDIWAPPSPSKRPIRPKEALCLYR